MLEAEKEGYDAAVLSYGDPVSTIREVTERMGGTRRSGGDGRRDVRREVRHRNRHPEHNQRAHHLEKIGVGKKLAAVRLRRDARTRAPMTRRRRSKSL